ncbi:MAG: hypothetical protein HGA21_02885 [Burkholderiaceae bacterium]|jgi:hypothetical protein|nr:hypothetical protein [Burkholderiaceae bacterium]
MKQRNTPSPNRRQTLLALIGTALLPACGGGDSDLAGLSSGGTGSFTNGAIVGLGSVIVNGIRYDDSTASVTIDGVTSTAAALQLGMVVRILGSGVTPAASAGAVATATATQITCDSEWKGQAAQVKTGASTFTLLGQTVKLLATTVFSGGGFDGTLAGRYVEVYGFINANDGSLQASRVEVSTSAPDNYRLSGIVTNLTATTFLLGSALINHASASKPANLQNGQFVRVKLQTAQQVGAWVANEVRAGEYSDGLDDDDEAEIEGTITAFTSSNLFSVNGIAVDASRITSPNGLALGVRVEVEGAIRNGVVIATKVEIETETEVESEKFEFHGTISALNTTTKTFVVRGYTVRYIDGAGPNATVFDIGTAVWANGLYVEVKAVLDSSGQLLATEIESDN